MEPDRTGRVNPTEVPHRRRTPRYAVHARVELRAGDAVLEGFATDVSEQGIRVRLPALELRERGGAEGIPGYLRSLERNFAHEVEVWWPREGLHTKAHLIRLAADAGPGADVVMGLHFLEPLPRDDWQRIRP